MKISVWSENKGAGIGTGAGGNLPNNYLKKWAALCPQIKFVYLDLNKCDFAQLEQETTDPEKILFWEWGKNTEKIYGKISFEKAKSTIFLIASYSKLSSVQQQKFQEFCSLKVVGGHLDPTLPAACHLPLLRSLFALNNMAQLEFTEQELGKIINQRMSDLKRVKKIHEKVIPVRENHSKGIKVFSKYSAGESNGGEFFDVINDEQQLFIILSSSSSYIISSFVLRHMEKLLGLQYFSPEILENFLEHLEKDILPYQEKDSQLYDLKLLLAIIDTKSMEVKGFNFGQNWAISNRQKCLERNELPIRRSFWPNALFNFKLSRGERLVIASPGLAKNTNEIIDGKNMMSFFKNKLSIEPKNFLNEIFYQLKKDQEGDFLNHDATVIYLEVNKNVILEI